MEKSCRCQSCKHRPMEVQIAKGSHTLIMVEGSADLEFIHGLIEYEGIAEGVHVQLTKGESGLKTTLQALSSSREWEDLNKLVVIMDANGNPEAKRNKIKKAVKESNVEEDVLMVRTFLIPDNKSKGELEDLMWITQPDGPIKRAVEQFLRKYAETAGTEELSKPSKRKVRAAAALGEDPELPTHRIARKLDFRHKALNTVRQFLLKELTKVTG